MKSTNTIDRDYVEIRLVPSYTTTIMGVRVVLLNSVEQEVFAATEEVLTTAIPDMDGLVKMMAMVRLGQPQKLSGADIRFIRKALQHSAKEFAEIYLGVTPETLSRWENDKTPLPQDSEKHLRVVAGVLLNEGSKVFHADLKKIAGMAVETAWELRQETPMVFERIKYIKDDEEPEMGWYSPMKKTA